MLIHYYNPQEHKKLNHSELFTQETIEDSQTSEYALQSHKNMVYYTTPLDTFDSIPTLTLIWLIDEQKKLAEQEASLLLKHWLLTRKAYETTIKQYATFFFHQWFAYKRSDLLNYIHKSQNQFNTYPTLEPTTELQYSQDTPQHTQSTQSATIQVSRQAIRNITWYSYNAIRQWDKTQTPVYVEWQHKLLEDTNDIIVVDGSRQIWKTVLSTNLVKLFDGSYKEAKDILQSDLLLWSNYQKIMVTQLIKNIKKPCYRITYDNWHTETVSFEHRIPTDLNFKPSKHIIDYKILWTNWDCNIKYTDNNINYTANEYYTTVEQLYNQWYDEYSKRKVAFEFWYNWKNKDLTYEEALLYWYFLWNWCSWINVITGNYSRLIRDIKEFTITLQKTTNRNSVNYCVNWYKQKVKLLGLWLSKDKFIDQKIFKQTSDIKYSVLDWLLNTAWYLNVLKNKTPLIEYCSVSEKLRDDIFLLCLSLWITSKKFTKPIRSNFKSTNTKAYYLLIQDINAIWKILAHTDLKDKRNYERFLKAYKHSSQNTNRCVRIGTIPKSAKRFISNSSRGNKLPWYNFQRSKIENWTFLWIEEYLRYSWHSISNIQYIWEQEVVSIWVDSNDELFFWDATLTHNSFTISEKLIEESHIPDNDSLVWAFLEKTTNVIRNYVLKLTKKFPPDYFRHFKKEWYIINNKTGTRIYFRTLSDWGDNVLWLTLKRAIIDEAQFVPESTFEDAINPTLSTTGWQLILIGTPAKKKTWYMYKTIMDMKRNIIPPTEGSYYKVSVDNNPFIHPKKRQFILTHKNEPAIRRQYYNEWGDVGDSLFSIKQSNTCPTPNISQDTNNFIVLWIDPARMNDRSAFSIIYCHYSEEEERHKATIIFSGQVPETHKKDWNLQAVYYKTLIQKWYQQSQQSTTQQSSNWYTVMDVTWVWDWVSTIFQSAWIKIHAKIRYTSWLIESNDWINFKVAKSILINNFIDMCQEWQLDVYQPTNQDLLEELSHIEEWESRWWITVMKSDFFDDITNASMISAYFINKRKLIWRTTTSPYSPSTYSTHIDNIENRQLQTTNLSSVW